MMFLKAKPVVIFSLMIIVPIVGTVLVVAIATGIGISGLIPLGTMIAWLPIVVTYVGYLWSAGVRLITSPHSMGLFRKIFLLTLVSAFLLVPMLRIVFKGNWAFIPEMFSLLNLIGLLYCINLICSGLKEREAESYASSKIADFLMVWILPIGFWFLQPRVQRLVN